MKKLTLSLLTISLLAACSKEAPVVTPPDALPPEPIVQASTVKQHTGDLYSGMYTATIATSMGDIVLELNADAAPMTVTNFVDLANQGYYNNQMFHRVITDFMVQAGDPNGNGTGGESAFGPNFKDEINAASYGLTTKLLADENAEQPLPDELKDKTIAEFYELQGYVYTTDLTSLPMSRGAIAMANRGPNTNGSQFFIIQKQGGTPWLEGRHTVFGNVTEGMDVVDAIAAVPVNDQDKPITPITYTITVTPNTAAAEVIAE